MPHRELISLCNQISDRGVSTSQVGSATALVWGGHLPGGFTHLISFGIMHDLLSPSLEGITASRERGNINPGTIWKCKLSVRDKAGEGKAAAVMLLLLAGCSAGLSIPRPAPMSQMSPLETFKSHSWSLGSALGPGTRALLCAVHHRLSPIVRVAGSLGGLGVAGRLVQERSAAEVTRCG